MADYRQSCCGLMGGHKESCRLHHNYDKWKARQDYLASMRVQGFTQTSTNGFFECRRGCGTVVWNVEEHIKNVCPTFNPVAGSE